VSNIENKDIFEIDMTRLDEEWVQQPKLFFKYAELLAKAKRTYEKAKANLAIVVAEVELDIKQNFTKYGFKTKPVVQDMANKAKINTDVIEAQNLVTAKKYKMDIYQAAVTSMEHRKSALERLVSLHGQNYFAMPVANDEDGRKAADNLQKGRARNRRKKNGS